MCSDGRFPGSAPLTPLISYVATLPQNQSKREMTLYELPNAPRQLILIGVSVPDPETGASNRSCSCRKNMASATERTNL